MSFTITLGYWLIPLILSITVYAAFEFYTSSTHFIMRTGFMIPIIETIVGYLKIIAIALIWAIYGLVMLFT